MKKDFKLLINDGQSWLRYLFHRPNFWRFNQESFFFSDVNENHYCMVMNKREKGVY